MSDGGGVPASIPERGLLVGWRRDGGVAWPPAGFHFGPLRPPGSGRLAPVLYRGDGHLMTIAPTGSGKGTGAIIPALLRHRGSVIVVDPKGENAAVTARRRRELGQQVVVLDPFGASGLPGAAFNPLDLLDGDAALPGADAAQLAGLLVPEATATHQDPYWDSRSRHLIAGLLLHLRESEGRPDLPALRRLLCGPFGALAALARPMQQSAQPRVRAAAAILGMQAARTRNAILATAQSHVAGFAGERMEAALSRTDFDLEALVQGRPLSIYLVIPPHRLESCRALLRVWIGALFALVLRRRRRVDPSTLFILDEAAQLGSFDPLRQAVTLLRGYGLQTWSFWQDLSQLQDLYPADWETMYNNCHVHQTFGISTMHMASSIEAVDEVHLAEKLLTMDRGDMQLAIAGALPEIARRPDYRSDPCFAGQFDPNPFYG